MSNGGIDLAQFYAVFFEEAFEHLENMEHLLLKIDLDAPDDEDLNAIFRAVHSIKGGGGTFGFTKVAEFTHVLENLLDRVRKQEIALTTSMVDCFLKCGDVTRQQLEAYRDESAQPDVASLILDLQRFAELSQTAQKDSKNSYSSPRIQSPILSERTLRIVLKLPDAGLDNQARETLFADLLILGKITKYPAEENVGELSFLLTTTTPVDEILSQVQFIAASDVLKIDILSPEQVQAIQSITEGEGYGFFEIPTAITQLQVEGDGYGFFEAIDKTAVPLSSQNGNEGYGFFTDNLSNSTANNCNDDGVVQPPTIFSVSAQEVIHPVVTKTELPDIEVKSISKKTTIASADNASIRVSVDKVDQLINLVGEVVITQAMVMAQAHKFLDVTIHEALFARLAELERNTRDLQEAVMSVRMLPISSVFNRFPRMLRDLAAKLGKQMELKMVGEHTELDKGLVELITDPLTHLVRNSLDHGIEIPSVRLAAGKPSTGIITLSAFQRGGNIIIQVQDDGAGLRRDKLIQKAHEKGIPIVSDAPDSEVWQLIFAPGFSTAEQVTDISGRGVGMDVVRKNILALNGTIELDSIPGHGTCTTIRLPLTLAIMDGMSIAVGGEIYVIALSSVVESIQLKAGAVRSVSGQGQVIDVRSEYLPVMDLREIFPVIDMPARGSDELVVIVESEGTKIALLVDELVGQQQVVVKSLESNYRKVVGISGATIMGDGRVAMILDVAALIKRSGH